MKADGVLLHFTGSRPQAIARELEKLPVDDIRDFLIGLPGPDLARVASQMSSLALTRLLAELTPGQLASCLTEASSSDASALVAHIPGRDYQKILDAADGGQKSRLQDLFGLHRLTIASQTTSDFIRVTPGLSCQEVDDQLGHADQQEDLPIFVVDDQSRYLGLVPILAILADHNEDSRVGKFMIEVPPIRAESSIKSVLSLPEWYEYPCLPVVDADNRLLGSVAASDLRRADSLEHEPEEASPFFALLDNAFELYADTLDYLLMRRKP